MEGKKIKLNGKTKRQTQIPFGNDKQRKPDDERARDKMRRWIVYARYHHRNWIVQESFDGPFWRVFFDEAFGCRRNGWVDGGVGGGAGKA
jgi:hypothetical protein